MMTRDVKSDILSNVMVDLTYKMKQKVMIKKGICEDNGTRSKGRVKL